MSSDLAVLFASGEHEFPFLYSARWGKGDGLLGTLQHLKGIS